MTTEFKSRLECSTYEDIKEKGGWCQNCRAFYCMRCVGIGRERRARGRSGALTFNPVGRWHAERLLALFRRTPLPCAGAAAEADRAQRAGTPLEADERPQCKVRIVQMYPRTTETGMAVCDCD